MIAAVTEARAALTRGSVGVCMEDAVLAALKAKLDSAEPLEAAVSQTKDLHSAVGKLGKALDKAMDMQLDICKAMRDTPLDEANMNLVVAEHFFREGRFDVGDALVVEAGIPMADDLKQPYIAMHAVLREIKAKNLQPALAWAAANAERLSPDGTPSSFEFRLQALNFVQLLKEQGRNAALAYGKRHFGRYQARYMRDIQRLMGCLVYYGRPLAARQYGDLLSPDAWDDAEAEFTRQACSLMGQASESPLAVVVAAGAAALPKLFKLAAVMEQNMQGDLKTCEQLPVELELGNEFVFHSIFACPVSREQAMPDNPPMLLPCNHAMPDHPPMLLPCNHVLCEQSVLKIAKSRTRVFKCPYCPVEARADNLRPLVFPDV
ncbi:hypothetical protein FOA52_012025 [Chlamydomonas sp. UWO 241]|nr:hypothetical protein FOA52_012025 [Chlamydomonas sp. UWO 241]